MDTYIISHHQQYREGLKKLIEITLPSLSIETASSVSRPIFKNNNYFLLVEPIFQDTEIRRRNIELIGDLTEKGVKVCIISDDLKDEQLLELLNFSIFGFYFKSMSTKDLILAIKRILRGAYYIPPRVGKLLLEVYQQKGYREGI